MKPITLLLCLTTLPITSLAALPISEAPDSYLLELSQHDDSRVLIRACKKLAIGTLTGISMDRASRGRPGRCSAVATLSLRDLGTFHSLAKKIDSRDNGWTIPLSIAGGAIGTVGMIGLTLQSLDKVVPMPHIRFSAGMIGLGVSLLIVGEIFSDPLEYEFDSMEIVEPRLVPLFTDVINEYGEGVAH